MDILLASRRRHAQRIQGTFLRSGGFTIIELLVAISIIAVLASLLLPVIGLVRDSSRSVGCMSNLRQVSLAYLYYLKDNDNFLPNRHVGANANHFDPAMFDTYLPAGRVWSCTHPKLKSTTFVSNWWMNTSPAGASPAEQLYGTGTKAIHLGKVRRPGSAWLAADLDGNNIGDYHRGYANMCFVDGHTLHRVDKSRKMNPTPWVNQDPSDSLKAEYMYPKPPAPPAYPRKRLKGFNFDAE